MDKILDSWAVLAWLQDERPAAEKVQALLDAAEAGTLKLGMCMINVGEVYYRLAKTRGEGDAVAFLRDLKSMPIKTLGVPKKLIVEAARLKGRYSMSYADAFAVATAVRERAPIVTGDPEIKALVDTGRVGVEWIGP